MAQIEERLVKLEEQVSDVKDRVSAMKDHAATLSELKSMLKTVMDTLQNIGANGFVRCAERSQIISYLTERVNKLEDGQIKSLIELEYQTKCNTEDISDIKKRLSPLEKRILVWFGAISAVLYAAPYVIKMIH